MVESKRKIEYIKSSLSALISILTICTVLFGGFTYIDSTYAKEKELTFVANKLEVKILRDEADQLFLKILKFEDMLPSLEQGTEAYRRVNQTLKESREEYNNTKQELAEALRLLKISEENAHK